MNARKKKESKGKELGHTLDLTVADALNMKTQQDRHQWFVQAHSRLQIFHVVLGTSSSLGMAHVGTAQEFRAGDFITPCKTSCRCAL